MSDFQLLVEPQMPLSLEMGIEPSSSFTLELNTGPTTISGGSGGSNVNTFTQSTPVSVWNINHNLGRYPIVRLKTLGTTEIEGEINHLSVNQFTVTFNAPQAGQAIYI